MLNAVATIFYLVAINIWVGGMFFVIVILGKLVRSFELPDQVFFWQRLLRQFFAWVWLSAAVLLGSGISMIGYHFGELGGIPIHIKLMALSGMLMITVFSIIYFVYYRRFNQCMAMGDIRSGRKQLRVVRWLGIINMVLGLCAVIVIGSSPYLFD